MPLMTARSVLVALAGVWMMAGHALGQSSLGGSPGQSIASPWNAAEVGPVISVSLILNGSTGDDVADDSIRQAARSALRIRAGDEMDPVLSLLSVQALQGIPGVAEASVAHQGGPMGVSVVFRLRLQASREPAEISLPKLYEDPGAMLKMVFNGGVGVYSDGNAFFGHWREFNQGSPIAPGPDAGRRVSFADVSFEPGLAGIAALRDPVYAYGTLTAVASGTWGQDIYQRNDRMHVAIEKAYAGLLWSPGGDRAANVSFGRQNYTLNDGFLVHHVKGSTNIGDRRAVYLGARTAHEMTGLFHLRAEGWRLKAFYLDPDEYGPLDSRSRFAGANLSHDFGGGLTADGTYIRNVASDTLFPTPQGIGVPRRGIATTALHLRWRNALRVPGLFLESEIARQRSSRADVAASAGYGSAGYRFADVPWRPAAVIRYAQWSGDRPQTRRYERWDPLLPAGSDEWMGGMTFSKYIANSNLRQWRFRLFAEPSPTFNFTVDLFRYGAEQTNNLGANRVLGTLPSLDLGEELMFTGRWSIGKHRYVQTLASINWPGQAIRQSLPGPTRPWTTLQASLYWFY